VRTIGLPETSDGHAAPITHVAYSPLGELLATSSYDGSVIIWPASPDRRPVPGARIRHRRLVNAASWSPQHDGLLATASADKTVGLWRVEGDGSAAWPIGRLARHTDDVNAVAWLPDGERLVTASEDSTALVWELRTGRFLGKFAAHSGHCMAIAVAPDGTVLSVGEDGQVFVGAPGQALVAHHRDFATSIEGCAWSPDGTRIALACDDGRVRLVSPELDLLDEIPVTASAARSVVFVADGSARIIVGSYDASVRLLRGGAVDASVGGGRLWPRSVDTCGDRVVVGSFGSSPVTLSLEGLRVLGDGGPDTSGPNAVACDGEAVAVGLDSGVVVRTSLTALRSGSVAGSKPFRVAATPVLSLASLADGWLAGTYGGELCRTDRRGEITATAFLGAPVPSLAAHPTDAFVLAGTYAGQVAVLDVSDGVRVPASFAIHDGSVKSISWLDETTAISGATDCAVRSVVRDGASAPLWYHGNLVNAVSADPRGLVASASRDRLVRAGVIGGPAVPPVDLLGGSESMKAVAVLGEGNEAWIIGGSYDFAVYAWQLRLDGDTPPDARAGEVLYEAEQAISTIIRINARTAIVASWDGSLRLVELRNGRPFLGPTVRIDDLLDASAGDEAADATGRIATHVA
jgi:WD40 repeat protein